MKTKIIGILAIIIAISASAFTLPKKANYQTSYKWFDITATVAVGAAPPSSGASYLNDGTAPMTDEGCPTSGTDQCVSGFNANQVNGSNHLINNSQTPQVEPYQKN
jgi:hypothetical protein